MSSIRELIVLQVVALLQAGGGPVGLTVHRERTRPIEKDQLPAILIYTDDDDPEPLARQQFKAPLVMRDLILHVEYRALGSLTNPPDAAVDPLIVWGSKQIAGNEKFPTTDYPDGLANGVIEGKTQWRSREGDDLFGSASQTWKIKYRTDRVDPTSKTPAGTANPPGFVEGSWTGYVNTGDAATLAAAKTYADSGDVATLAAAEAYTDAHTPTGVELTAHKDQPNGYPSLDVTGHIPIGELPASIQGALEYQGVWDASANSPALASGVGTKGFFYKVSVAGNTTLDGSSGWHVGDLVIFDGTTWDKVDNYEAVTSVAGKTGAVTLVEGDIANLTTDLAAKAATTYVDSHDASVLATAEAYTDAETTRALAAESTLTTAVAGKQAALGFTPENVANKDTDGTLAANSDTRYPSQKAIKTYVTTGLATKQDSLGFTAENIAHKDAANGYAGLDANSMLKASEFKLTRYLLTGTSYAIQDSDRGKIVEIKNATAATIVALTIAQAGAAGAFADGWSCTIKIIGSNSALLTPTTSTIEGANVLALPPNATCVIYSDGSNFFVCDPSLAGPTTAFCTVNELEVNSGSGSGTAGVDVGGNVFGWLLWLKAPKFVKHVTFKTSTGVAATTAAVGLYDVNGNKIFSTGSQATATSNLQVSVTLGSTYLLLPWSYRTVWTMSSTSLILYPASANNIGSSLTSVWNAQSIKYFKSSNVAASGDTPASLGTYSASALSMGTAVPFVMFEQ